jgi:hypothetical protein
MNPLMRVMQRGLASGGVAASLLSSNFDVGSLRPMADRYGRVFQTVTNNSGKEICEYLPTVNADSTLRKNEWQLLDTAVIKAAKPRLRAWGDLVNAGLTFDIPNGMSKTVLQHQTQSDITGAIFSMDGLRESNRDRPLYDLTNLPLPIVHKDFSFSAREIAVSRNGSTPLDTTTAELAGRRVAEAVESLLLGVSSTYTYGGGTIYGYTNYTNRATKVLTNPSSSSTWTPATTVAEVLAMRNLSQLMYHYGPWMVYCSPNWDTYMDDDYSAAKGDKTLRQRIAAIDGINGVRTLDYLTGYQLLLVQMSADVVRAVQGMQITTVQWESHGGMMLNFKVMAIMVPQIRCDHNNNTGIVHGTAS